MADGMFTAGLIILNHLPTVQANGMAQGKKSIQSRHRVWISFRGRGVGFYTCNPAIILKPLCCIRKNFVGCVDDSQDPSCRLAARMKIRMILCHERIVSRLNYLYRSIPRYFQIVVVRAYPVRSCTMAICAVHRVHSLICTGRLWSGHRRRTEEYIAATAALPCSRMLRAPVASNRTVYKDHI